MEEAIVTQGHSLTAKEVRSQVNLIQEVMKGVMKGPSKENPEGVHYGIIPGCKKPTLLKPGAEKLLSTFKIAAEPIVEDLSTDDCARYRVTVRATGMVSGAYLGSGVGECSSDEEKYKWKRSVCDEEFEETPEDRRRVKWCKAYNKPNYQVKQIRTNYADVANTILKMAKKRGQIDMCLTVTAASDIFTQDIEEIDDLPNGDGQPKTTKPKTEPPKPAEEQKPGCVSLKQRNRLWAICRGKKSEEDLKKYLKENWGIESTKDIKKGDYEMICKWAELPMEGE